MQSSGNVSLDAFRPARKIATDADALELRLFFLHVPGDGPWLEAFARIRRDILKFTRPETFSGFFFEVTNGHHH
jgi:hypothetical protein